MAGIISEIRELALLEGTYLDDYFDVIVYLERQNFWQVK